VRAHRNVRFCPRQLLTATLAAGLLWGCDTGSGKGDLSRAQCVEMVLKVNKLRNAELGRATSVNQRTTVDGCMAHGTKAQFECVQFANNAGELKRCDDLAK
jgi:hypothetical protein